MKCKTSQKSSFRIYVFLTLFSALILAAVSQQKTDANSFKISHLDLLLPSCPNAECNGVYAPLRVNKGNFLWETNRPDLIEVRPIRNSVTSGGFFTEVLVYSKSKATKEEAVVRAVHQDSSLILVCNVHFGEIAKLEIMKTGSEVALDGNRELRLVGFNEFGDAFSSLLGWEFSWSIIKGGENASIMRLNEGLIEVDEIRQSI